MVGGSPVQWGDVVGFPGALLSWVFSATGSLLYIRLQTCGAPNVFPQLG